MFRSRSLPALQLVLALVLVASPVHAAVSVYTSLAAFQTADPTVHLATDFETHAAGGIGTFSEGGLTFSSPFSMYIIGPTVPGTTLPLPTSKMLSASGPESFFAALNAGWTYSIGFTILVNAYGPHIVTLYNTGGTVFFTYHTTQAHNTVGFVGFVSDTKISKVHWVSDRGEIQNTALDNFYIADQPSPAVNGTWGRIKASYR